MQYKMYDGFQHPCRNPKKMATAKQLDYTVTCPICTEVYTDPRVLPCVHTYCLKCIEAWSKDKQPGDKLACPLCRNEFTLSSNGVKDLPKNAATAASTLGTSTAGCSSSSSHCYCQQKANSSSSLSVSTLSAIIVSAKQTLIFLCLWITVSEVKLS